MRAVRLHAYGGPEQLRLEEVDRPSAGRGQLLIRVRAAGVNPVDWKIRKGSQRAVVRLRLPAVLGMDVSGVVEEVGSAVTDFSVGDEVFCSPHHTRQGGYADYVAVNAEEVAPKPARLSHVEAASIPLVGLTAWECLVGKARLREGEKVFVQAGAGGVGSFAIQLARVLGAEVSTTCSEANGQLVRSLGASRVVDYRAQRFEEVLRDQDVVLDSLGGDELERSLLCLRRGGRLVTVNTGLPPAVRRWGPRLGVVAMGLRLLGFFFRARLVHGVRFSVAVRPASGLVLSGLGDLLQQGEIRPVVGSVYPLEEIAAAHRESESGHSRGKIVLDLDA